METNQEEKTTLIFGLSPRATLVNSFVLAAIAQLVWASVATWQIIHKVEVNIPWYFDLPINVLSLIMFLNWIDYKFKLPKGEMSWRTFKYRFVFGILSMMLFHYVLKLVFLILLFPLT
jgi:hypothetical protein